MRLISAAALAALLCAGTPAGAFTSVNGLTVKPVEGGRFIVLWGGRPGDASFWCAAADYAGRRLGLRSTDRIWRISEPPRHAGQGIVFSTSAEGAASDSGITRLGGPKRADFSLGAAETFCDNDVEFRNDD